MAIGADVRLSNPTHVSLLPTSSSTLYALTRLDDAMWAKAEEKGLIRPGLERSEVERFRREATGKKVSQKETGSAQKTAQDKTSGHKETAEPEEPQTSAPVETDEMSDSDNHWAQDTEADNNPEEDGFDYHREAIDVFRRIAALAGKSTDIQRQEFAKGLMDMARGIEAGTREHNRGEKRNESTGNSRNLSSAEAKALGGVETVEPKKEGSM